MAILIRVKPLILAVLLASSFAAFASVNEDGRRDWLLCYGGYTDAAQGTTIAERYELGVEVRSGDMNLIRLVNPNFIWIQYISVLDQADSGSREANYCWKRSHDDSQNPEMTLYFHYWDSTVIALPSDGTDAGSAADTSWCNGLENATTKQDTIDCRVHVYNMDRHWSNLLNSYSRQYRKEYACSTLKCTTKTGSDWEGTACTTGYYDGIMWDNGQYTTNKTGTTIEGGHIYEINSGVGDTALHTNVRSSTWWTNCLKVYYDEVQDTFDVSENWHPDSGNGVIAGKKLQIPNGSIGGWQTYWTQSDIDGIFDEYHPYWTDRESFYTSYYWRGDSAFDAGGMYPLFAPHCPTSLGAYGSRTFQDAQLMNLAIFYLLRGDSTMLYHQAGGYWHSPASAGWDTAVWRDGSWDYNIGDPVQDDFDTIQSGTDNFGYNYRILQREYDSLLVIVRPRRSYNDSVGPETICTLFTDSSYEEMLYDGSWATPATQFTFRNADARFLRLADSIPDPPTSASAESVYTDYSGETDSIRTICVTPDQSWVDSLIICAATDGYPDSTNISADVRIEYPNNVTDTNYIIITCTEPDTVYVTFWAMDADSGWSARETAFKYFSTEAGTTPKYVKGWKK